MLRCLKIKLPVDCNSDVKTLPGTKHVILAKVILLHRLDNVNTLFALQDVDLVASEGDQYYEK